MIAVVLAVALVVASLAWAVWVFQERVADGGTAPSHTHPSGEYATSSPGGGEPADPFAGTPAADFPVGAEGIALPAAKPTGTWSAKQVATALRKVRLALIVSRLDERMLVGHDPSALLELFPADVQEQMRKDFTSEAFTGYATWIHPSVPLAADPPRVSGRTTYRVSRWDGTPGIEVVTNYVWVYAFTEGTPQRGGRLAIVHDEVTWFFPTDLPPDPKDPELWLRGWQSYHQGIDCDAIEKGLLAPGKPGDYAAGEDPDPDSYYDPDRSLEVEDTCS